MKRRRIRERAVSLYDSLTPLQKALIALGATGVVGYVGYKVVRKQMDKIKMRSDIKKFKEQTIEDLNINLAEVAKQVFDALKLGYAKYDPRSWDENEEEATLALLKVPKTFIRQLENVYQSNHGRNLRDDLQSYLDEYWYDVRHLFV